MRAEVLYIFCAGLCAGIALTLLFSSTTFLTVTFLFFGVLCVVFACRIPYVFLVGLFCLAATLGVARTDIFVYDESGDTLANNAGRSAIIAGTVVNDPEKRTSAIHAYLRADTLNGQPAQGVLLAVLPLDTELYYGDRLEVRGLVEVPEAFETDTHRIFDYPSYLRTRGISALMYRAQVRDVEEGDWSLRGSLYALKHVFEQGIEKIFNEPRSSLLMGILLGERRGLPEPLTEAFIIAGLIHVVVLSGYNIAIVAESIMRLLRTFLPQGAALLLGAVAIVLFALMAGAGAATVRATLMGMIAILSRYLRRPSAALRALAVAATAMALWNPPALLYDPGFMLSVLATFGLITLSPFVERHLQFVTERLGLRSITASTIAVQIFILPALLYMSGILSLFSLPANMLALPVVPFAMFFGFLAGLAGLIHPLVAALPGLLADGALRWMILVAEITNTLPLSSFVVPSFSAALTAALYLPLIAAAYYIYRREELTLKRFQSAPRTQTN